MWGTGDQGRGIEEQRRTIMSKHQAAAKVNGGGRDVERKHSGRTMKSNCNWGKDQDADG